MQTLGQNDITSTTWRRKYLGYFGPTCVKWEVVATRYPSHLQSVGLTSFVILQPDKQVLSTVSGLNVAVFLFTILQFYLLLLCQSVLGPLQICCCCRVSHLLFTKSINSLCHKLLCHLMCRTWYASTPLLWCFGVMTKEELGPTFTFIGHYLSCSVQGVRGAIMVQAPDEAESQVDPLGSVHFFLTTKAAQGGQSVWRCYGDVIHNADGKHV